MARTEPDIPHFAYPLRIDGSEFAVVEQDSGDEIQGAIEAILRTPQGHVDSKPTLGLPDLTFRLPGTATAAVAEALELHEPRSRELIEEAPEALDELVFRVTLTEEPRG